MSRSRFLSTISLAAALAGCPSNPTCGPQGAPEFGATVSDSTVTFTYGDLVAGANNDCPDTPDVTSLTIQCPPHTVCGMSGSNPDSTALLTLCIPRPDKLEKTPGALGTDVQLVEVTGTDASGCTYSLGSAAPSGTATAAHMCDDGTNPAGFALTFAGTVSLDQKCGTTTTPVTMSLTGTMAVAGP
ncbi:MAG TPA: hypothetical protein VLX92_07720 [Kofleriaceae bacterium]|nr:hypothetical protein [Kofleriaceae bacterium]